MKAITRVLAVLIFSGWASSISALPIGGADTVTVDGNEWAQVDLFTNLSWWDIWSACPSGECQDGATLNGNNMRGWRWASVDDINGLFNSYIGSEALGPGPSDFFEIDSLWAPAFYADGWRPTSTNSTLTTTHGWSSTAGPTWSESYQAFLYEIHLPNESDRAYTGYNETRTNTSDFTGAWFYREVAIPPPSGVPAPATLILVSLTLAGLGWARRKKA
ncbi:Uncharacterised protein [Halioglobus japonicus]|nr:Uncharacterised protein [Halioglobus japonicus]